jgi:uncharacterized membrane protein
MGYLEELGESVIKQLNKVFYYLIGLVIKIIELYRRISKSLKFINFYQYLEKRGVEEKDYHVLKTQLSTMLFLIFSVLYIFEFIGKKTATPILLLLGFYSLFLISSLKKYYSEDFKAYRDFFLSYLGVSVFFILVKVIKPRTAVGFPFLHLLVLSIAMVAMISVIFKKKYGRDYTFGKVIDIKNNIIKVKVNYDLRSSVKPGVYIFEKRLEAKKGDILKLKTERHFLNLRGSKVTEVLALETKH